MVLQRIAAGPAPLHGIVHAAGVLDDGILAHLTWDRFQRVIAPKVLGAWNLHTQSRELPLDFFVLFSSLTSSFGSPGQSNYAAANAFLDALAQNRRQIGLPALSVNWPPWADVGMAALRDGKLRRWAGQGLLALQPDQGLDLLETLLEKSPAQVCVAPADWPRFLEQFPPELSTTLFAGFDHRPARLEYLAFQKRLQTAPTTRRSELLVSHVRDQVMAVLNLPASAPLPINQGFFELGMDSLMAMEVRNRLQNTLGLVLPVTVVLENGTIAALAAHLIGALFPSEEADSASSVVAEEELGAMLAEIESLSESEIDRELAEGADAA
jgi:acyl carrier protein